LPADTQSLVRTALSAAPLRLGPLSRDGKTLLGSGTVALVDNLVDQTTGTIRIKAIFPNDDNRLWPGDFVNARLLAHKRSQVLTVPSTAVQRGPNGVFAYVVKSDNTVEMRPLQLGEEAENVAIVEKGLQEGERVTTSNQYRLQPGARVQILAPGGANVNEGRAP